MNNSSGTNPNNDTTFCASKGLLIAPFADRAVVYDTVDEQTHITSLFAAWVLGFTKPTPRQVVVEMMIESGDLVAHDAQQLLDDCIRRLSSIGLIGRTEQPETPAPFVPTVRKPEDTWAVGKTHGMVHRRLAFCGPDPTLIGRIDSLLGVNEFVNNNELPPTDFFAVIPDESGAIDLIDAYTWRFPDLDHLLWQLPTVINDNVSHEMSMVVMHAGAVRTPSGKIIMITGPVDAGKSTLVAALVQAGCDYLGDESLGFDQESLMINSYPKPLTLDPEAQSFLGLDPVGERFTATEHRLATELRPGAKSLAGQVGTLDLIIHTGYRPDEPPAATELQLDDALRTLLLNTLNLVRSGQSGLETLCRLAERVPVVHIVHGDSLSLAALLTNTEADPQRITDAFEEQVAQMNDRDDES